MPIPIVRLPPPALERSLVPYTVTMIQRICDGMLRAFGGDFQTGVVGINYAAAIQAAVFVTFPTPFNQTTGPAVLVTPINTSGIIAIHAFASANDNTGVFIETYTSLGGAYTGVVNVRWVAWYP